MRCFGCFLGVVLILAVLFLVWLVDYFEFCGVCWIGLRSWVFVGFGFLYLGCFNWFSGSVNLALISACSGVKFVYFGDLGIWYLFC